MRASTRRMLSFLISLVFLIGSLVVYSSLISPAYENVQRLRGSLAAQSQAFEEQRKVIEKIGDLLDKFKQGNQSLKDMVALSLPNDANTSQILGNLNALAEVNNLSLLRAQTEIMPFQASVNSPDYIKNKGTVKSTVALSGGYDDFKKFLSQVESNVRIMDVKQWAIKPQNGNSRAASSFEFDLAITSYFQDAGSQAKN